MKKIIVRRTHHETAVHDLPAHLHPVLRRVYLARQLRAARELECSLDRLLPFTSLQGTDAAVELLVAALHEQKRLLIVADFDADGATSCAVAVRALRLLGARNVDYVVPNRFKYGYGLTPEIVAVAAEQRPDLLITVDNGISSLDGVAAAKARGMQVLITDHHLAGAHLTEADAIVNPTQPSEMFASKAVRASSKVRRARWRACTSVMRSTPWPRVTPASSANSAATPWRPACRCRRKTSRLSARRSMPKCAVTSRPTTCAA